jgi:hypothetical protein
MYVGDVERNVGYDWNMYSHGYLDEWVVVVYEKGGG